jgi:hypothetical protein
MFKKPHPEIDLPMVIAHSRKTPVNTGLTMLVTDVFATDRRPALAKIGKPTLVIASAESPLLDPQKKMSEATKGAHNLCPSKIPDTQYLSTIRDHLMRRLSIC